VKICKSVPARREVKRIRAIFTNPAQIRDCPLQDASQKSRLRQGVRSKRAGVKVLRYGE